MSYVRMSNGTFAIIPERNRIVNTQFTIFYSFFKSENRPYLCNFATLQNLILYVDVLCDFFTYHRFIFGNRYNNNDNLYKTADKAPAVRFPNMQSCVLHVFL